MIQVYCFQYFAKKAHSTNPIQSCSGFSINQLERNKLSVLSLYQSYLIEVCSINDWSGLSIYTHQNSMWPWSMSTAKKSPDKSSRSPVKRIIPSLDSGLNSMYNCRIEERKKK